jgi:protein SCO1/2
LALVFGWAAVAWADGYGVVSSDAPPPNQVEGVTQGLGFDQNLGAQVPADAFFKDENGQTVKLGDYWGQRPMVLVLAYYTCPNMCTVIIRETFQALQTLNFHRDDAYSLVFLSINPKEGPDLALPKQRAYLKSYPRMESVGYTHFLTGSEDQIRRVAGAIGFRYRWDDRSNQYVHPSGLTILTPEGKVSKYLYGIRYDPRDLRLALVEASSGRIGSPVDRLMLFCYRYDPASGKYGFMIMSALRIFGGITVAGMGGLVFGSLRRERRKKKKKVADPLESPDSSPGGPGNSKQG